MNKKIVGLSVLVVGFFVIGSLMPVVSKVRVPQVMGEQATSVAVEPCVCPCPQPSVEVPEATDSSVINPSPVPSPDLLGEVK